MGQPLWQEGGTTGETGGFGCHLSVGPFSCGPVCGTGRRDHWWPWGLWLSLMCCVFHVGESLGREGGTTSGTGGFGCRLCVFFLLWGNRWGRRAGALVGPGTLAVAYV